MFILYSFLLFFSYLFITQVPPSSRIKTTESCSYFSSSSHILQVLTFFVYVYILFIPRLTAKLLFSF